MKNYFGNSIFAHRFLLIVISIHLFSDTPAAAFQDFDTQERQWLVDGLGFRPEEIDEYEKAREDWNFQYQKKRRELEMVDKILRDPDSKRQAKEEAQRRIHILYERDSGIEMALWKKEHDFKAELDSRQIQALRQGKRLPFQQWSGSRTPRPEEIFPDSTPRERMAARRRDFKPFVTSSGLYYQATIAFVELYIILAGLFICSAFLISRRYSPILTWGVFGQFLKWFASGNRSRIIRVNLIAALVVELVWLTPWTLPYHIYLFMNGDSVKELQREAKYLNRHGIDTVIFECDTGSISLQMGASDLGKLPLGMPVYYLKTLARKAEPFPKEPGQFSFELLDGEKITMDLSGCGDKPRFPRSPGGSGSASSIGLGQILFADYDYYHLKFRCSRSSPRQEQSSRQENQ